MSCARPDGAAVASLAAKAAIDLGAIKDGWNGFSVLHTAASRVGALDLGFVPADGGLKALQMAAAGTLDLVFLLGADEIDVAPGASSSISARMAIVALPAPMWCCLARLIPRNPRLT